MGKSIKDHMRDTFDGLEDLKRFKIKLRDREGEPRVRQVQIAKVQDSLDLVDLMVNTFTEEVALAVTLEILEAIDCNQLAKDLRENTRDLAAPAPQPGSSAPSAVVAPAPQPGSSASSAEQFIDKNMTELIKRANNMDAILDELQQKNVITHEDYSSIRAEKTQQLKMRELLNGPIRSAGARGKKVLYDALMEKQLYMMQDLGAQGK